MTPLSPVVETLYHSAAQSSTALVKVRLTGEFVGRWVWLKLESGCIDWQ